MRGGPCLVGPPFFAFSVFFFTRTQLNSQIKAAIAPGLGEGQDAVAALGALSAAALGGGAPAPPPSTCAEEATPHPPAPLVTAANSVWARPPLAFTPGFLARASALHAVAHPLTTASAVNAWCAAATAGRIKEIVDEGGVARAVAILANALYFKGAWAVPFNAHLSGPGPFYAGPPPVGEGEGGGPSSSRRPLLSSEVHFMSRAADKAARLLCVPGVCTALRLPYGGSADGASPATSPPLYEAVIILQEAGVSVGDALAAVEAGFAAEEQGGHAAPSTTAALGEQQARAAATPAGPPAPPSWCRPLAGVNIRLPAFTVDAPGAALGHDLQALGITAAFSAGADFSAMLSVGGAAPAPASTAIADVLHKVWIATDEQGTEGAAVTAVVMVRAMLAAPVPFTADRPFLFGVRHGGSGAWLFLGRVGTPAAWKGGVDGGAAEGSSAGAPQPGCSGPGLVVE